MAKSLEKCNNVGMFFFFLFFPSLSCASTVLNLFLVCPTVDLGSTYCLGVWRKGGSESKTRHLEFVSSQVGNATQDRGVVVYDRWLSRGLRHTLVNMVKKLRIPHNKMLELLD
jgi:hypothetical protein